jgi:hypothetical protein
MTVSSGHGDHDGHRHDRIRIAPAQAALHRELAANVPWDVSVMAGNAADRNVELRLAPPFPLKRLPGA